MGLWFVLSVMAFFITGLAFVGSVFHRSTQPGADRTMGRMLVLCTFAFTMLITLGDTVWDLYITVLQTQDIAAIHQAEKRAGKKLLKGAVRTAKRAAGIPAGKKDVKLSRREKRAQRRAAKRVSRPRAAAKRNLIAARTTPDRKYELLGYLCLLAVVLFIFGRPNLWQFIERTGSRLILSWRGVSTFETKSEGIEADREDVVMGMVPTGPPEGLEEDAH